MQTLDLAKKILSNVKNDGYLMQGDKKIYAHDYCADAMPLIEKALENEYLNPFGYLLLKSLIQTLLPAYTLTMQEMFDGTASQKKRDVEELFGLIDAQDYKTLANQTKSQMNAIMEKAGLSSMELDTIRFMQVIVQATTDADRIDKNAVCFGNGPVNDEKPVLYSQIIETYSMQNFLEIMKNTPRNGILFGYKQGRVSQSADPLYEAINGYPCELVRNTMKNNNCTKEEALASPHHYSSRIYLGIKNGASIWIYGISDNDIICSGSFTHNSVLRKSFWPYQVLFKDPPKIDPENCTQIEIRNKAYSLKDLLDDEQSVWLPMLMVQLDRMFFKTERPETEPEMFANGIAIVGLPDNSDKNPPTPKSSMEPQVLSYAYTDSDKNIMAITEVTPEQGINRAILPDCHGTYEQLKAIINRHSMYLLQGRVDRTIDLMLDQERATGECICWLNDHQKILENIHRLVGFAEVNVNNQPITDLLGNPMESREKTYGFHVKNMGRVHAFDVDGWTTMKTITCFTPTVSRTRKPPLVIRLFPQDEREIAAMCGCQVCDLPPLLQLMGYVNKKYDFAGMSCQVHAYAPKIKVTICTNKRDLKAIMNKIKEANEQHETE